MKLQAPRDLGLEVARLLVSRAPFRERAAEPLQRLQSMGAARALLEEIDRLRLTALVGSRAIAMAQEPFPPPFTEAVTAARATNRARALGMEALATRVVDLLEAQGIKSLPVKGPFLSRRAHGDPSMRVVNDLDILVCPDRIQRSVSLIVEQLGYERADPPWLEGRPDLHYVLRHPEGQLPRIEVHWRIHWYEEDFSRTILEGSVRGADGLPQASSQDEFMALLLFYARDACHGLRLPADIAGWWDRHGAELPEQALARYWETHPQLRPSLQAATTTAERIVGLPAGEIIPAEPLGMRVRLASRLANWPQLGERDQVASNLGLVDGLLAPADRIDGFLARNIFLSQGGIAHIYRLRSDDRIRVRIWQILHPPKVLIRYVLGVLGAVFRPQR